VAETQALQHKALWDESRLPRVPEPGVIMIFGASGDLTARKLISTTRKGRGKPHLLPSLLVRPDGRGKGAWGFLEPVMRPWSGSKEIPSYPAGRWGRKMRTSSWSATGGSGCGRDRGDV
jgi:glucose-6-phosphate 1-dehydrogenase